VTPRLHIIRYAGFAGAALLAVAAYLGGALPSFDPNATPITIWQGSHGPLIILAWFLGVVLMTAAWWAAGRVTVPLRWAYLTAGLWLLPLAAAPPLGSRDVYPYACQGAAYAAGANPYHVTAAQLPCTWLDSISPIWRDTPAPYGPFFVLLAGATAGTGSLAVTIALLRLVAVLGVILAGAFLPVLARRCGVPEGRATWLVLGCPLVGMHLVSGAHNDALMVGLLVAGLAVVRPRSAAHLIGGGALLGLAVAVKATAAVVLPFAALAVTVRPYQIRSLVRDGGLVVGGAVAAVLTATLATGLGFGWVGGLSRSGDSVQWTSPPTAVGMAIGYAGRAFGAHVHVIPVTRAIGVVVLAVVLLALLRRVWQGDPPLYGAGLALIATVALSPVFHPWYATWPLAVLAATTARARAWWYFGCCAAACFLVLPDGTTLARPTGTPGSFAMTAVVIGVCVYAWRRYTADRAPVLEPSAAAARGRDG
jgi:hypothetical protein